VKQKREGTITAALFRLVTGQLPTSRAVVEKHLSTFLDRAKVQPTWRQLIFHVGTSALSYDMRGEFIDEVEIPAHTMVVPADAFEQVVGIPPGHRADVEANAHRFVSQAALKGVPTLRFTLSDGSHVNLGVQRVQRLEQYRKDNPEQWRRFVEYDERGGGEAGMWSIPLAGMKQSDGDAKRQSYHDACMARGTVVGDRLLVPDRVFTELKATYGEFVHAARRSFARHSNNPAPEVVVQERLAICETCEKWLAEKARCKLACCGSPFRIADADYQCIHPDGPRWYPHEVAPFKLTAEIRDVMERLAVDKELQHTLLSMAPTLADQLQSFVRNPDCGTCRFSIAKALNDNPELLLALV
jgi:hypothetical protein